MGGVLDTQGAEVVWKEKNVSVEIKRTVTDLITKCQR